MCTCTWGVLKIKEKNNKSEQNKKRKGEEGRGREVKI